jgi:hypothetical protein
MVCILFGEISIFIPELWDFIHQIVGDFSYVSLSSNHFSTQLSFYWGTSLVQTDLNKLKVKCCRLEIAVYSQTIIVFYFNINIV